MIIINSDKKNIIIFGPNKVSQLGIGHNEDVTYPQEINSFKNKEIINVYEAENHSLISTNKGLYWCGHCTKLPIPKFIINTYDIYQGTSIRKKIIFKQNLGTLKTLCIGGKYCLLLTDRGLFSFGIKSFDLSELKYSYFYHRAHQIFLFEKKKILSLSPAGEYCVIQTENSLYLIQYDNYRQYFFNKKEFSFFKNKNITKVAARNFLYSGFYCLVAIDDLHLYTISFPSNTKIDVLTNRNSNRNAKHYVTDNTINDPLIEKIPFFFDQIIIDFSVGRDHNLILTEDSLYSFGNNDCGQLAIKKKESFFYKILKNLNSFENQDSNSTTKIHRIDFFDNKKVLQFSAQNKCSIVLTDEGLYCWGNNENGNIGAGNLKKIDVPTKHSYFYDINPNFLSLPNYEYYLQTIRYTKITLILLARKFEEECLFYKDFFPLDVFKYIILNFIYK